MRLVIYIRTKSQEFHNRNIGLFSVNETGMYGYFMGIHRYLNMRKIQQVTISSDEFISIPTNKKFTKEVTYIHDNKWLLPHYP